MMEEAEALKVAIPFEMLFDTEMGLVNVIKSGYRSSFFLIEQAENEDFMKMCLRDRESKNPLSVMVYDGDTPKEELDDMYFQFMEREYDRIIRLSPSTKIWELVALSQMLASKVEYTVTYLNDIELEVLDKYGFKGKTHKGSITDKEIMDTHSVIYVKDISVLLPLPEVHRKHVYVADYSHNLMNVDGNIVPAILFDNYEEKYSSSEFSLVNLYRFDVKIPSIEDELGGNE